MTDTMIMTEVERSGDETVTLELVPCAVVEGGADVSKANVWPEATD